jgi:hypothetical protein
LDFLTALVEAAARPAKTETRAALAKEQTGSAHRKKRRTKMKIKVVLALTALSYVPLTVAGDKDVYPRERVAEFIVEKLDVTSLPVALRPKKEKGKKTFADYGFTAQGMDEAEIIIQAAGGTKKLSIKVLDQRSSGIYVCITEPGQIAGQAKMQSVVLLKRKDSNTLLKGRESWREFAACPVVGATEKSSEEIAGGD